MEDDENQIVTEVDAEDGGRASRFQRASPILIGVSDQGVNMAGVNVKSEGECALHAMQDALE